MRAMKNKKPRAAATTALCALAFSLPLAAQHEHQALPAAATELHPGLGDYHFPITTATPEAQLYFDHGIRLLYGFNHDEAARYFRRAAELDPQAPMPYWGVALSIGPNYNDPAVDAARAQATYDAVKNAVNRLAFSHGHELARFGATAVAVTPGWLRSEMMLDNYGVSEADWRAALHPDRADGYPTAPPGFAESETPRFVGRGIAAIAADDSRARWNQRSVSSAELAREYGFTDLDGRRPDAWSST